MASNNTKSPISPFIFGGTLVVLAASIFPLANATTLGYIGSLTVTGRVCCTATGTCVPPPTPPPPIAAATATLECLYFFSTITIATTTTTATGGFTFNVPGGPTSPYRFVFYNQCRVRVRLPVPGCARTGSYLSNFITTTPLIPFPGQAVTGTATIFNAAP